MSRSARKPGPGSRDDPPCAPFTARPSSCLRPAHGPDAAPSPSPARGAPPPVTFAVEVGYVEVDAIVTDRNDQPVRDLSARTSPSSRTASRRRSTCSPGSTSPTSGRSRPRPPPVPLDVQTNAAPFEGRVYVIVLDELHTSTSRSLLVRAAARRFIERHFGEGDLAAVVHTSGAAENGAGPDQRPQAAARLGRPASSGRSCPRDAEPHRRVPAHAAACGSRATPCAIRTT